eukprot:EG_transcript_11710
MLTAFLVLHLLAQFCATHATPCSRDLARFASDRTSYDLVIGIATGEDNDGYKSSASRASYFRRRMSIRRTWKAVAKQLDIPAFFMISDYRLPEADQQEAQVFQDMLLIPDPHAQAWGYNGAPKKTEFLMQFISHQCADVKYVAKSDDDAYVHVPRLQLFARITHGRDVYVGFRLCRVSAMNAPKHWQSPEYEPRTGLDRYPCYMQGGGWLLSGKLAKALGTLADTVTLQRHSVEDATIGMWLMGINHTQVDIHPADMMIDFDGNFNADWVLNVICNDRWLFLHRVVVSNFSMNFDKYCGKRGRSWAVSQWATTELPPHIPPFLIEH